MPEFRYQGVTVNGKLTQGSFFATNQLEAKKKVNELAHAHGVKVRSVNKRAVYQYKVKRSDSNRVFSGEISAFTREEVQESLAKMGFKIVSIQRKLFSFRRSVPQQDVVMFIRLCADLLREKFPYDEILTMLANDIENRTLRDTIMEIHRDLKSGKEGHQVYLKHSGVLGKFTAHMLSIASTSGNMAEIYDNTAKFLDRSSEFRKNLRSVLFMPSIVVVASIGALIFYVSYIFPQVAGLLLKYDVDIPPMTAATLNISDFLKANFISVILAIVLPVVGTVLFFRSPNGRIFGHKLMIGLPIVGNLFYRSSIEVFARVFHALYTGAGENIEALRIASEACRNAYIEKVIKEQVLPIMLREGRSLSDSLEAAGVFPQNAVYTLRSGEESGTMREATLRLANFYEKEVTHRIRSVVDLINLIISIFVSLLIVGITLLSSEIGFVSPPMPGIMKK